MPDITDKNKQLIRIILRKYCQVLSRIPFEDGLVVYSETYKELYVSSARWKLCLLCGEIKGSNTFTAQSHDCSPSIYQNFPILVKTSWIKLQDFFLSDRFLNLLRERGMEFEIKNEVVK
ncbi:MAG: hypothetical protein HGN29_08470 [Asgard group archaeon]|nr:hypothetical protein [Asgard group archaeon]